MLFYKLYLHETNENLKNNDYRIRRMLWYNFWLFLPRFSTKIEQFLIIQNHSGSIIQVYLSQLTPWIS